MNILSFFLIESFKHTYINIKYDIVTVPLGGAPP